MADYEYGILNNISGKNTAESIADVFLESRGWHPEKARSDVDRILNGKIPCEIKSKVLFTLCGSKAKYKYWFQLTTKKQESYLKNIFVNRLPFFLVCVFFHDKTFRKYDVKMYPREELSLNIPRKRLGWLFVESERLRKRGNRTDYTGERYLGMDGIINFHPRSLRMDEVGL